MPKKSCQILYNKSLKKIRQHFLDIQYEVFEEKIQLQYNYPLSNPILRTMRKLLLTPQKLDV